MDKDKYIKRLAEVLGVTHKNMLCAIEVVEKEVAAEKEKHEESLKAKAEEGDKAIADDDLNKQIAAGQTTSDKFDDGHDTDLHSHGNEVDSTDQAGSQA